jgi:hypothetical protein
VPDEKLTQNAPATRESSMTNTTPGGREPILDTEADRAAWAWLIAQIGHNRAQEALNLIPSAKRSYVSNAAAALGLTIPEELRPAGAKPKPPKPAAGPAGEGASQRKEPKPRLHTKSYPEVATQLRALSAGAPHGFNIGMRNSATGFFAKNWTPRRKEGREDTDGLESKSDALSAERIDAAIPALGYLNLHGFARTTADRFEASLTDSTLDAPEAPDHRPTEARFSSRWPGFHVFGTKSGKLEAFKGARADFFNWSRHGSDHSEKTQPVAIWRVLSHPQTFKTTCVTHL